MLSTAALLPALLVVLPFINTVSAQEFSTNNLVDPADKPYFILQINYGAQLSPPHLFNIIDPWTTPQGNCTFPAVTSNAAPMAIGERLDCAPRTYAWSLVDWQNPKNLTLKLEHCIERTDAAGAKSVVVKSATVKLAEGDIETDTFVQIVAAAEEAPAPAGWQGDAVAPTG